MPVSENPRGATSATKRIFLIAFVYGLISLVPMFFLEAALAKIAPPAITHPEFYYGFLAVALVWQWLFLEIARDPAANRRLIPLAIAEKLLYVATLAALFAAGRVAASALAPAVLDAALLAGFVYAYLKLRPNAGARR